MAKSSTLFTSPDDKVEAGRRAGKPKGARRRVSPRRVTKADAAAAPTGQPRGAPPEAAGEATEPVAREAAAAPRAAPDPAREQPVAAPPTEAQAAAEERPAPPPPSPPAEVPVAAAASLEPGPVASETPPAGAATISDSGRDLVEGTIRLHGELLAFGWRQTEQNLAVGRAMLASRSLPEILALQTAWLGNAFGDALTHGLELSRLASAMMRSGPPGR